ARSNPAAPPGHTPGTAPPCAGRCGLSSAECGVRSADWRRRTTEDGRRTDRPGSSPCRLPSSVCRPPSAVLRLPSIPHSALPTPTSALRTQRALHVEGALDGVRRAGEGNHEGVALALHFVAVPPRDRLPDQGVVLVQDRPELFPQALPESGGVLDVREHQGD